MACEEHWWSNRCNSKGDIRYDPTVSADIEALNPLFGKSTGFWEGILTYYEEGGDGFKRTQPSWSIEGLPNGLGPKPYSFNNIKIFFNVTASGTRLEQHYVVIHEPAPLSFCIIPPPELPPPAPVFKNTANDGICGINGHMWGADAFKVSTHEKSDVLLGVAGTFAPPGMKYKDKTMSVGEYVLSNVLYQDVDVVSTSWPTSSDEDELLYQSQTWTFDPTADSALIELNNYFLGSSGSLSIDQKILHKMTRVDDAETWLQNIEEAADAANVTDSTRKSITIPINTCIVENNPGCLKQTDSIWCEAGDASPLCGPTPYIENTTVNAVVVTTVAVVLSVSVVGIAAYALHRYFSRKQKRLIQLRMIRGIAQNITISSAPGQLNAETLQKEFELIDRDKGGTITKDEMKQWLEDGKLGEISDKDFNSMWVAMDIDGDGAIDFVEFASFLSSCGEAFDEVFKEQERMTKAEKIRFASRRLSTRDLGNLEEGKEEREENN